MLALAEDLQKNGANVYLDGESRFCKCSGISVDHGHLTQKIRDAKSLIVCVDGEFLRRVNKFNFGDHLVTGFTVAKTLQSKQILVVVSDPTLGLMNPVAWGWCALFARLSHLEIVDLSMDRTTVAWASVTKHIAGWCKDHDVHKNHGDAIGVLKRPSHFDECSDRVRHKDIDRDFRSPWLRSRRDGRARCYDVFLTHNWGPDEQGRDNHHGLEVFLDDWEMARYRSIDEAMVLGMRCSSCVVVLLTKKYIEQISQGQVYDNCVAEFNMSRLVPGTIVAVMEDELKTPDKWRYNAIFGQLSSRLYVDTSSDAGHLIEMMRCGKRGAAVQRWYCSLDALEIRIRTETAMMEGLSVRQERQEPMPFIPHRDSVMFMSGLFFLATSLDVLAFVCTATAANLPTVPVMRFVSWLCWSVGFFVQAFTQLLYCRKPLHFDVHWVEVPWATFTSITVKCRGAVFGLVGVVLDILCEEASSIITSIAFWLLFIGNLLNLLAVGFIWRNSEHGFNMHALASFRNLPLWGAFTLALASLAYIRVDFMARAERLDHQSVDSMTHAELKLLCHGLAAGLMMTSTMLYFSWALRSNRALARYFQGAGRYVKPCQEENLEPEREARGNENSARDVVVDVLESNIAVV